MGLKDFIVSNVDLSKVDTGIVGLSQYGILGNMFLNDAKKIQEEKKKEPRQGKYCDFQCPENENCKECLRMQQQYETLLFELEQLERGIENPQEAARKKITECSLCGAPYEKGAKICPYCDTSYPTDALAFDIPTSNIERNELLKVKASQTYNAYKIFAKIQTENKKAKLVGNMPGFIQGATNGLLSSAYSMMELSADELMAGANQNGMKLSQYIVGIVAGTVKQPKLEQLEALRQQNNEMHQRNMQIERERQEKLRKINQEKNIAMGNLVYGKTTNFAQANSTKQECWNCGYYYRATGTCTRTNTSANSSGSCYYWK